MKKIAALVFFALICTIANAQNTSRTVPRVIYVGDPASLILTMLGSIQNMEDVMLLPSSPSFPLDDNIDFHRIILERRAGAGRLFVEFTAFAPGYLEFPGIEIGGEFFTGLSVTVNSVINSSGSLLELSRPASSLAMPGTALMFYGVMTGFVLLLLFIFWFSLRGYKYPKKIYIKVKRWMMFVSIMNTKKRLSRMLIKGGNKRFILDNLCEEFRVFLSFITGSNCRAMTAREFEKLPESELAVLGNFFCRCDKLRFSGIDIKSEDIFSLLDDMFIFTRKLYSGMLHPQAVRP